MSNKLYLYDNAPNPLILFSKYLFVNILKLSKTIQCIPYIWRWIEYEIT